MSAEPIGSAIAARIAADGPISLHDYMGLANAAYYASRDPLGTAGDFVTAPEISQIFGEMIGLWLADIWHRAGAPVNVAYVELGPGRGTLASDALRALSRAGCRPQVHLVETSPSLRRAQAERIGNPHFHDSVETLPTDRPLLIVANEFFDALPIRQLLRSDAGWRERCLTVDRAEPGRRFVPILADRDCSDVVTAALTGVEQGSIVEVNPGAVAVTSTLASRLATQGGVMIAIDYGYAGPAVGDSFQAVAAHRYADPFVEPGSRDLTAHVDFTPLVEVARDAGCIAGPMVEQGAFLLAIGMGARAGALARAQPDAQADIARAFHRLTDAAQMGRLFKVLAIRHAGWPEPEGF